MCSPLNTDDVTYDWGPACGAYSPEALEALNIPSSFFATFGQNYELNVNGSGLVTLATTPVWSYYQVDYYGSLDNPEYITYLLQTQFFFFF